MPQVEARLSKLEKQSSSIKFELTEAQALVLERYMRLWYLRWPIPARLEADFRRLPKEALGQQFRLLDWPYRVVMPPVLTERQWAGGGVCHAAD